MSVASGDGARGSMTRSQLRTTSAEVNGVPSENSRSGRRWKTTWRPSVAMSQLDASAGRSVRPVSKVVRDSKSWAATAALSMSLWAAGSSDVGAWATILASLRAALAGPAPWASMSPPRAASRRRAPAARRGRRPGTRMRRVCAMAVRRRPGAKRKRPRVASPGERSARGPATNNEMVLLPLRPGRDNCRSGPTGGAPRHRAGSSGAGDQVARLYGARSSMLPTYSGRFGWSSSCRMARISPVWNQ